MNPRYLLALALGGALAAGCTDTESSSDNESSAGAGGESASGGANGDDGGSSYASKSGGATSDASGGATSDASGGATSDASGGASGSATGGGAGAGGTSSSSTLTACTIADTQYADGSVNPENDCAMCDVSASSTEWTPLDTGIPCSTDSVCYLKACTEGCWIDETYYATGEANPQNPCQSCVPTTSTNDWTDVPTARCISALAVGDGHTCALVNGAVKCWGANSRGQIGNDSTSASVLTPAQVVGLTAGVTAISGGVAHSCALINGAVKCWGRNNYGEVGNNSTADWVLTPTQVEGLTSGVTAIADGMHHSCAIVRGGAYCWGCNFAGQLGSNSSADFVTTPTQVIGLTSGVTAIAAGAQHTCVLVSGAVKCWGYNLNGQVGNNSISVDGVLTPTEVHGLTSGVTAITGGGNHTCALVSGSAYCWGDNSTGQLGNNSTSLLGVELPTQVYGLTSDVTAISGGNSHTCAIVDGAAKCWGYGGFGQIGEGSRSDEVLTPVQVYGLTSEVTAISSRSNHTCALANGNAYCWGYNYSGQIGNGARSEAVLTPMQVTMP